MTAKPSNVYLAFEFTILYVGLPFAVWYGLSEAHLLIIPALLSASLLCLGLLLRDPGFDRKHVWNLPGLRADITRIMLVFLLGALLLSVIVFRTAPSSFLDLPRRHAVVWSMIMLFYPLVSVPPQELIYRVFLFRRYAPIFPAPALRILVSAVTFSLAHIIFGNILALTLTLAGGFLFAFTYHRTRSLAAVSVEHALYGCFVFTVGLGNSLLYGTRLMIERLAGTG